MTVRLDLPREVGSVPAVRRLLRSTLDVLHVDRESGEDLELAITEACANVIDHATDTDSFEVQVEVAADRCSITVLDHGTGFDGSSELGGDDDETGRGLRLMTALVDRLAFRNEPQAGTVVHMVKNLEYDSDHPLWQRLKS